MYRYLQIILLVQSISIIVSDIAILDQHNKSVELFIDYKISYTPPIPEDGIYGALTFASPADACKPINPPPSSSLLSLNNSIKSTTNWFVLAYRSSSFHSMCSNREKIQHAVNAGYKAIILYSPMDYYQTSIIFTSTTFEHINITIPAVLVSHEDGEQLRQNFLYKYNYHLYLTSELPPNFGYYLIPFAIIIGAGILIIISYVIFQLMMCIMERRKAQRHRLSRKDLKKVTLQKYEKGIFYETCAICLEDYIEGEKIRILPCNHAYHQKCIDPWLTKNRRVCPVCKAKVKLPGMNEYSDSDSDDNNNNNDGNQQQNRISERTPLLQQSMESTSTTATTTTTLSPLNIERLLRTICTSSSSTSSTRNRNRYTNIPELLDDTTTIIQPSTSAPIISAQLSSTTTTASSSSNNNNNNQMERNNTTRLSQQQNNRRNRRKNQRNYQQQQQQPSTSSSSDTNNNRSSVIVIAADLHQSSSNNNNNNNNNIDSSIDGDNDFDNDERQKKSSSMLIIAPTQLSINCDSSDIDETITPATGTGRSNSNNINNNEIV